MKLLQNEDASDLLLHIDATGARGIVTGMKDRFQIVSEYKSKILQLGVDRNLVVPTFNYDFCSRGIYDLGNDQTQLGPVNEALRLEFSPTRTRMPVFNFVNTKGKMEQEESSELDPFDKESIFGQLYKRNGLIVWFGAGLNYTTMLHHVERIVGVPYRYDKKFYGKIIDFDLSAAEVCLKYHVWPRGIDLKYDWVKLELDLNASGILQTDSKIEFVRYSRAREIVDFWVANIAHDNLYCLTDESKIYVETFLQDRQRGFQIEDFE